MPRFYGVNGAEEVQGWGGGGGALGFGAVQGSRGFRV